MPETKEGPPIAKPESEPEVKPGPEPTPIPKAGKCRYCGETETHRSGCPAAIGKEADCKEAFCPGCSFRGRPCPGPKR